jgi:hypothetical protein
MALKPRSVSLHIEELVLDGFAGKDRFAIAEAVERELTRLIEERGLGSMTAAPASLPRLDGGAFQVARGASAKGMGTQLAEAIHRPLATPERRRE